MLGIVGTMNLHMNLTVFDSAVFLAVVVNAVYTAHCAVKAPLVGVDFRFVKLVVPNQHTTFFIIFYAVFFGSLFHFFIIHLSSFLSDFSTEVLNYIT